MKQKKENKDKRRKTKRREKPLIPLGLAALVHCPQYGEYCYAVLKMAQLRLIILDGYQRLHLSKRRSINIRSYRVNVTVC